MQLAIISYKFLYEVKQREETRESTLLFLIFLSYKINDKHH